MRRILINALLSFASLLVLFAMGELTVRILQHNETLPDYAKKPQQTELQKQVSANSPKLKKIDNPVLHVEYDTSDPRVNAFGMRGPLPTLEKPAGTYRIAVLGDSVAFGFGLPREQSFPFMLENILHAQTDKPVEVLNFAVIGYSLASYLEVYRERVRPFHPDLVLMAYVLNDMTPPSEVFVIIKDVMKEQAQLRRLAHYSEFAAWCVITWKDAANKVSGDHSFTAQYADPATAAKITDYMTTLGSDTRKDNAKLFAVIFPYFTELEHYPFGNVHDVVNNAMQQAGIDHYDLLNDYRNRNGEALQLQAGDITHPNGEGNRIAAEAIARKMEEKKLLP